MLGGYVYICESALWLRKNTDVVLTNWVGLVSQNIKFISKSEFNILKNGFITIINDFTNYLSKEEYERYYNSNRLVARKLAECDISFQKFIKTFHLFEESYTPLLLEEFKDNELNKYLIAIDNLHHDIGKYIVETR